MSVVELVVIMCFMFYVGCVSVLVGVIFVSFVWLCLWNGLFDVVIIRCCILVCVLVRSVCVSVECFELIGMIWLGVVVVNISLLLMISDFLFVRVSVCLVCSVVRVELRLIEFVMVLSIILVLMLWISCFVFVVLSVVCLIWNWEVCFVSSLVFELVVRFISLN